MKIPLLLVTLLAAPAIADEDATWTAVDQPDGSRVTVFDIKKAKGGPVEVRTRDGAVVRGPAVPEGERARVTVVEKPGAEPVVVIDREKE